VLAVDKLRREVWVEEHDTVGDMILSFWGYVLCRLFEAFVYGVKQYAEVVFLLWTGV
jgi:hypothetical protein